MKLKRPIVIILALMSAAVMVFHKPPVSPVSAKPVVNKEAVEISPPKFVYQPAGISAVDLLASLCTQTPMALEYSASCYAGGRELLRQGQNPEMVLTVAAKYVEQQTHIRADVMLRSAIANYRTAEKKEQLEAYESTPEYKAYATQEEAKIEAYKNSPENTCPRDGSPCDNQ